MRPLLSWLRSGCWCLAVCAMARVLAAEQPSEKIGNAWQDERNPIVQIFEGERLDLWSLQPVAKPALPDAQPMAASGNAIDIFLRARLEQEQSAPAREADRRTLARRLWFDLVGLPPDYRDVERFVADQRPDAYQRLVDELLASPRYGEQMARLWLDVIRYSDSNGFDWDEFRPEAWRYRDYVIRSLNADKPYDQFVIEQLAGDELLTGPPRTRAEQDALLATTYLRLGPQDNSAGLFDEQSRARAEWMTDLVETTGSAFLGMTLACCRCHDHKHDPLSHADHYRFRAFFEPLVYADSVAIDLADEQAAIRAQHAALAAEAQPHHVARQNLRAAVGARLREERRAKLSDAERALLALPIDNRSDEQQAQAAALEMTLAATDDEVTQAFSDQERAQDEHCQQQIQQLEQQRRTFTHALLATDKEGDVPATHVLDGGNHKAPLAAVAPGIFSALDPGRLETPAPPNPHTKGRRLALAKWIASRDNPLTARVLVNRLWQHHFGQGLVATPNDFGLAGARPSHPALLDWLAGEFVEQGWSIKTLQRQIVLSAAYRQASTRSADARGRQLFAHQMLRRLTAEQLRDALLIVSGALNAKHAGPPVWPELPADVLQANPALLDDNATRTKGWYPSPAAEQDARSVFLVQKRTVRVPFLETFDLPENTTSCARRNVSTVAPQAFSLLNSPLAVKAAQDLAARVERAAGDNAPAQIRHAFQFALQRQPAADEAEACRKLLESRGLAALCRALLNLNEFLYLD